MFVRQNQQQFRNSNADVQIFYGEGIDSSGARNNYTWNKPTGVSHVYMLLIGCGGNGDGTYGGSSGGVTVWYGAAQHVPDVLYLNPASPNNGGSYILANSSNVNTNSGGGYGGVLIAYAQGNAGGAVAATQFTNTGFYQSVNGQVNTSGGSTPTTTFLTAGGTSSVTANYGYSTSNNGFFTFQPIICGLAPVTGNGRAIYGCGGDFAGTYTGGPGLILIASW